ncbi:MAG: hypothetical protein M3012_07630 [Staphylococcus epidermidis]|nr:hypothetical protein [Staphylococcus epidermidis]MCT6858111.1 hypothetical protein [Apilactobacillus sp.]
MIKIKTFINNIIDHFDDNDVNEFMKDKNVLDVKLSECDDNTTVMVIYKVNEQ